ncbi:restriction endonuclease subunit S [Methylophaga muralis]|uniref:Type I restriction modification DNA specificity domain protein n=1 Tax=Methylophaga muralis TaxID=291169 RepID=A0A1E3GSY2_9GAMM|nr:restriction endonuclease subunit S [Methylophaga muralis]ODN67163.1 Type I restriction modification DNA specificity domain protein [Methylophaga muralis]
MSAELGHFAKVQGGFAFKSKDFGEDGIPVVKIANVTGGGFVDLNSYECIQPSLYPRIGQFLTEPDDVLIAMTGANVGKVVRIGREQPQCAINQRVGRLQLKGDCEYSKDFFYYLTSSPTGYQHFIGTAYGSAQPNISGALIERLQVPNIPPITANQAAGFLRKIDDKIQLNQQINQTFEQMAQAIFKSWFVDFEPVKAKIAALEAGGSEEDAQLAAMQAISGKDAAALATEHPDQYNELRTTAELFPSAMHDSELGEIPAGWSVGTLNDLAHLNKNTWSKRTLPPEIDYVDLANTKNGVIETVTKYVSDDAPSRARRILSEDDTIIGTVRPGNRSFAFIKRSSSALTGSTGFAVLTPKHKALSEFVYIAATCDESINQLAHLADGGAYPAVRADVVASLTSIIPTDEVLHRFHDIARPYFECIANLKIESASLEQTRDALLPKLLSGELTVTEAKDAEHVDVLN